MTQNAARTVRPDGSAIRRLREERGWRVEDLAAKANCSDRTIRKAEKDGEVYLQILTGIANALEVEYKALLPTTEEQEESPEASKNSKKLIEFTVTFDGKLDEHSRGLIEDVFDRCRGITGELTLILKKVEEGSIKLTIEGSREAFEILERLFKEEQLSDMLGVKVEDVAEVPAKQAEPSTLDEKYPLREGYEYGDGFIINGLPDDATSNDIYELVQQYGTVVSCGVVCDRDTQRSRGFATVKMLSVAIASEVVAILHGSIFRGHKLSVRQNQNRKQSDNDRGGRRRGPSGGGNAQQE